MAKEPLLRCGDFGLHVIKFPSGKYGYAGSIPVQLFGDMETLPVFSTEEAAIAYAHLKLNLP